ncbi:MAG: VOC family protein [Brevinema sp.]
MKIEHIALYVKDLEGLREFFIKYFQATSNEKYFNPKTGFSSYFLSFKEGSRLELMNLESTKNEQRSNKIGYAHIAFSVGSKEKVDELTERFRADSYQVTSNPRTTGDGYYESCILDFEGNLIEITV